MMSNPDEIIGYRLYCDGRGLRACAGAAQRRGWIRAQHEAAELRLQDSRERQSGRVEAEPDWLREEMAN